MKTKLFFALISVGLISACASRHAAELQDQQDLSAESARVRSCISVFVLKTDSPRLTGNELAEAGAAACAAEEAKLRQMLVDQDRMPTLAVDPFVQGVIRDGEREALAALAVRDRAHGAPANAVAPQPQT